MLHALLIALALTLPFAVPGPTAPAGAPEPTENGCAVEADVAACRFTFDTRETPTQIWYYFDLPGFSRTLATITILLEGRDHGWQYSIYRVTNATDPETNETYPRYDSVSGAEHAPAPDGADVHTETDTHLLLGGAGDAYAIQLRTGNFDVGGLNGGFLTQGNEPPSLGVFRIAYVGERLPEGEAPVRPAATRDDPHVADPRYDARFPELDVTAAWFDDPRVGDGLIEARLAVHNLSRVEFNASIGPVASQSSHVSWAFEFHVAGAPYVMTWRAFANGTSTPRLTCYLGEWRETFTIIVRPVCEWNFREGVLSAVFPERSVGSPGYGEPFEEMRAYTYRGTTAASSSTEDAFSVQRYAFALGGPPVWDVLNPRLAVRPPLPSPWYEDPAAPENLPNTLQVLGAVAASATFVGGLVVVRRHRALTRRLLREVEGVARRHERDARQALLALGRLQGVVSEQFHRGEITEAQYQAVSQRIALEATRFALARDLGLDDGVPGDAVATTR